MKIGDLKPGMRKIDVCFAQSSLQARLAAGTVGWYAREAQGRGAVLNARSARGAKGRLADGRSSRHNRKGTTLLFFERYGVQDLALKILTEVLVPRRVENLWDIGPSMQ